MKKTLKFILLALILASPFILRGCFFFYQGRYGKLALQEDCDYNDEKSPLLTSNDATSSKSCNCK